MNFIKSIIKTRQFYEYLRKCWIGVHSQKLKSSNKRPDCNGMIKLGDAVPGVYKFSAICCDDKFARRPSKYNRYCAHMYSDPNDKLVRRLFELGFLPNEKIIVIENRGSRGGVMVKIKDSKIALNRRAADKILLNRE